jgi:hypothetical protein
MATNSKDATRQFRSPGSNFQGATVYLGARKQIFADFYLRTGV